MQENRKIKRSIKAIYFLGDKTKILFRERFTPKNTDTIVNEETPKKSDFPRHRHFDDAMKVFAFHWAVRMGFAEPVDRLGKAITAENADYFKDHIYLDDERIEYVKPIGILITTKEDTSGFQIICELSSVDGQIAKIKSFPISTLKVESPGFNYPLQDFAAQHIETLLIEAEEFLNYKTDQLKLPFDKAS